MLLKIKSFILKDSSRQVGLYTITGSLCKVISFTALPFFVNTLSAADIGILTIFSNSIIFLTPIISMGVLYTFSIEYFKLAKEKYAIVFSTSLMIPAVLSLLLVPVLYFFTATLERTFNFQQQFFWLIPICLFFNFCFEAFIILIRNQNNVKLFTIISLLKVVVEIGFSILFVVFIYRNWYSRALGFLLSGFVVATIFFLYAQRNKFLVKRFNFKVLQKELNFGLSGLLLQTAIFFVGTSDKFFVMFFFGKEKAGYYSVASTFAAIQYLVCAALLQYLSPILYKKFAELHKWQNLKYMYFKYTATMFATFIGVTFFTFIVYHFILKAAYKDYVYYSYLLGISSFLWTISNVFLQYIIFNKSKRIIFKLSVTTIFISISLNYFTSKYGDVEWLCVGQIVITSLLFFIVMVFNKRLNFFNSEEKI